MAQVQTLAVTPRERAGKGAARAIRRDGDVPGVVYGAKEAPEMVAISQQELMKILKRGHFLNTVFEIETGKRKQRVLPRDLQLHPVTDLPLHFDLLRLTAGSIITIEVPVEFKGHEASPGLKRGGVLNVVRHEVEVDCPADGIPEAFVVDLAGLDIGDSVHISHIALPEGVKPTVTDRDFTIATIAAPTVQEEETAPKAEEAAAIEAAAEGAAGEAKDKDKDKDKEKDKGGKE